ncbi:GNAT family N-acetyltransferase [Flavobacteriaceae bacterium F89]|uniref:GNAT family N-acetyltransferase n=1 Tax=Cerina litoralis TaxID=2874477 RepID=A0AAE3EWA6_9FLAO|nr:GNAT family N-acetyltransferase [Cerina litoralis]MCG2460882.1 GNAT family N-acetyltransferase [Cerina litoralis]
MKNFKIEPLIIEDATDLCRFMVSNTDRFKRYLPKTLAQNGTPTDSEAYIRRKNWEADEKEEFTFTIKDNTSGNIIGIIILKDLDWVRKKGELAYCIDKNWEGNGVMTEVVKSISTHAFSDLELRILQIIVYKSNKGSLKVAEKAGFTWQKTLYNEHTPPNEPPLDMELFELKTPKA